MHLVSGHVICTRKLRRRERLLHTEELVLKDMMIDDREG